MSRIRFESAEDVFNAFPPLAQDMESRPSAQTPVEFVRELVASETPIEALTFLAYVLPRREAIWWYCRSLRSVRAAGVSPNDYCLKLAESWVKDPGEATRLEALAMIAELDASKPASWAAIATAWSGGSLYVGEPDKRPEGIRLAAPYLAAQAVRGGLMMLFAKVPSEEQHDVIRMLVDDGLEIAASDKSPMGMPNERN